LAKAGGIKVATYTHHPNRAKNCVFCKYWLGDAGMVFVNSIIGYKYEASVKGPCARKNGASTFSCYSCPNYAPSPAAEKLL